MRARTLPKDAKVVTADGLNYNGHHPVYYVGVCRNHPNPIPSRRPMSFRALKGA